MHFVSSQFALGRSLGCYCLILALLVASSCYSEPPLWGPGTSTSFDTFVLWQALEGRLLLANWMGASFMAGAVPLLYLVRRVELHRRHGHQICNLKEFAAADPDTLVHARQTDKEPAEEKPRSFPAAVEETPWFAVLGVSPSATVEDVKQAYKVLVKQNHPDRVANMSAVFKALAEAETKKLNVAYSEALSHLRQDDFDAEKVAQAA